MSSTEHTVERQNLEYKSRLCHSMFSLKPYPPRVRARNLLSLQHKHSLLHSVIRRTKGRDGGREGNDVSPVTSSNIPSNARSIHTNDSRDSWRSVRVDPSSWRRFVFLGIDRDRHFSTIGKKRARRSSRASRSRS